MKTKLTLFVTVLAVALFGMGCASTPKPDVANAVKWNGHWYAVLPAPCNWETANKKCERLGGHLAFVETEAENKFLTNLLEASNIPSKAAWLGGTDEENEGDWLWLNGKPITTSFWDTNQPGNAEGVQHYIQLWAKGKWNDVDSSELWAVICEWE